jgi:hypothetical protein
MIRKPVKQVKPGEGPMRKWVILVVLVYLAAMPAAQELSRAGENWFSYGGERIGQGRENARRFLIANPQVAAKLEERLRKEIGLAAPGQPVPVVATPEDEEEDGNGSAKTRSGPREMKVAGARRTEARS